MKNFKNSVTVQKPSPFGMSISGHACATGVATLAVRNSRVVMGADFGRTTGYFPGTPAWRPPIC